MAPPPNPPTPPTPPNPGNPGNPYDPNAFAQGLFDLIRQNEEARKLKDNIEDQTNYLKTQKTLRSEILSLSKKLYEITRDIEYLEDKELGTRETVLSINKEINKANKAEKQLRTEISRLSLDQSINAQTLVASLKEVVEKNEKNVKLLEEQKDLSEKIRNNFGVKPFSFLAEFAEKWGGKASLLSTPFEKGAKAARESAKENFLNNKKIQEQIALREELNAVITAGSSTREQAERLNLRNRDGSLATGAVGRSVAISKLNQLPDLGSKMTSLTIGLEAFTKGFTGLLGGLTGLLKGGWIGMLVSIGKFFIDAMFAADKQVTDIAKNFNISKDAARKTRDSFFDVRDKAPILTKIQEGNLLLQKDIVESNLKLNELLGTSVNLATDLGVKGEQYAAQLANASKFLALNDEEQKGLIQSTAITGKTIDQTKNSIVGITRLRKLETGILVNERAILKDVLTASNSMKVSIKGGEEALTRSAIRAKELGLSLSQVDKIADSLLNFESSITAELEAELLTNKELNLEQARYYALTNDIEGLTEEIANNQEIIDTFAGNNRIAQAKIAQSLGMSREEMANMVTEQETLNKFKAKASSLDADTLEQLKKNGSISEKQYNDLKTGKGAASDYYRALKDSGKLTSDIIESLGSAAMESLEAQDAQSKFNDALEKAKETFSRFVDGGFLDQLADAIVKFADFVLGASGREKISEDTIREIESDSNKFKNVSKEAQARYEEAKELATDQTNWFTKTLLNLLPGTMVNFGDLQVAKEKAAMQNLQQVEAGKSIEDVFGKPKEMALGGIVTKPTRALIGEAGPEAVLPLTQLMNEFAEMKKHLASIASKNYTPVIEMNGIKLSEAQDLIINKG